MKADSRTSSFQQSHSRRGIVELGIVAVVLYVFVGAPGLSAIWPNKHAVDEAPPRAAGLAANSTLIGPSRDLECEQQEYGVHVFSTRPLIIYIDGFLKPSEATHLIDASADRWQASTVYNNGIETTDPGVRRSERALVKRDHTVQCLEARALAFQGWPADTYIEQLWTQRYNVSGHYAMHYDWAAGSRTARRASTFNVYVQAPGRGGGTHFPRLEHPGRESQWCSFIECDAETGVDNPSHGGVVFKPRAGAAVFWQNFDEEGKGFKETIHAGLPVLEGSKIGLNIWSWYQRT